jgi:hypothetical protein
MQAKHLVALVALIVIGWYIYTKYKNGTLTLPKLPGTT